jgi:hypothetical protein
MEIPQSSPRIKLEKIMIPLVCFPHSIKIQIHVMRLSPTFPSGVSLYQPQAFQRLLDPFSSWFPVHLRNIFLGHGDDDLLDFKDHASGCTYPHQPIDVIRSFLVFFLFWGEGGGRV